MRTAVAATLAALLIVPSAGGAQAAHHRRHGHPARHARLPGAVPPYGQAYSPTPSCRYPDGTPYDPDIIGGANHVGAGGPAVNYGGFNPCGLY